MDNTSSSGIMVQKHGDVHVVEFMDKSIIDQVAIEHIKQELLRLVEQTGHPKFVISFENVSHISSAMLGVLMTLNKRIEQDKGQLRLAAIAPSLMEVFKITRLDKMLKIFKTSDDALLKF